MKITMRMIYEVENNYGVNLTTVDGKEKWAEKVAELMEFAGNTATPFFNKVKDKKLSKSQLNKKHEINAKLNRLEQEVNFERLRYYVDVYSMITNEDKMDDENLSRQELETFIESYEKAMKRTFILPNKTGEDPKKKVEE